MIAFDIVVAADAARGIAKDGDLPWHLPGDLAHFKRVTTGHVVIMGRKTFESIGRALPRRTNIVVTRDPDWSADGVVTAQSVVDALELAEEYDGDAMVIGGGQVYAAAMPLADRQVLTEVHSAPDGDVHYPRFRPEDWLEVAREQHDGYDLVWLERADTPDD